MPKLKMPRERANERACDAAIEKTLAYRAVFKYPLSQYQLYTYLISKKSFSMDFFKKELSKMVKKDYIESKDNVYFSKSIRPVSWELRVRYSSESLQKNNPIFKLISSIPWVKLIGVTGSVAAYNADRNSDIDMFIITEKNRVWITRGLVALILRQLGKYATSGEAGKICPNLFIDETALTWEQNKQTIYTAHEIAMMQPLFQRDNMYFRFIKANHWIFSWFPHFKIDTAIKEEPTTNSFFIDFLEVLARKLQLTYMKKKKTHEITNHNVIHFNKNDNSSWILDKFEKNISK